MFEFLRRKGPDKDDGAETAKKAVRSPEQVKRHAEENMREFHANRKAKMEAELEAEKEIEAIRKSLQPPRLPLPEKEPSNEEKQLIDELNALGEGDFSVLDKNGFEDRFYEETKRDSRSILKNHPGGTTLSGADIKAALLPVIQEVFPNKELARQKFSGLVANVRALKSASAIEKNIPGRGTQDSRDMLELVNEEINRPLFALTGNHLFEAIQRCPIEKDQTAIGWLKKYIIGTKVFPNSANLGQYLSRTDLRWIENQLNE